MMMMMMTCAM